MTATQLSHSMTGAPNPNEFVRLLTEHQFRLYAYILSLVANCADADDVMQETSLALWEMFEKFEPGSDFFAWSCSVARFRVLKHRERGGRQPAFVDEEVLDRITQEVAERGDELDERRRALDVCVRKLGESDRELLRQTYDPATGTLKQVAEVLGRSINTVYKAVSRIHQSLYDCVRREMKSQERGADNR